MCSTFPPLLLVAHELIPIVQYSLLGVNQALNHHFFLLITDVGHDIIEQGTGSGINL